MTLTEDLKPYKTDEKKFYAWFRDGLAKSGRIHIQRIENTVSPGVPDINICDGESQQESWIELKILLPEGIVLRKEQYAWGMKRAFCGGNVYIISLDVIQDVINIYVFPRTELDRRLDIEPRGNQNKYVRIVSEPHWVTIKRNGVSTILKIFRTGSK